MTEKNHHQPDPEHLLWDKLLESELSKRFLYRECDKAKLLLDELMPERKDKLA